MGCQAGCVKEETAILAHWEAETYNAGCYNPASVLDDGHTPSPHAKGEAYDVGIEVPFRGRNSTGQALFLWLYANRGPLGIVQIIWDGQIWSSSHANEGIRSYTVNPHHDHIHVQLSFAAAHDAGIALPSWGGGATPLPAPHTSPFPPSGGATPTLGLGSEGVAVKLAQQLLVNAGAHIAVDGLFGPATGYAVRVFQQLHGLGVDGVVGPKTWAQLIKVVAPGPPPAKANPPVHAGLPTVREGDKGPAVGYLQGRLNGKGSHLTVDGNFGPATDKAVRAFQSNIRTFFHLPSFQVDGIVGPATWFWVAK